MLAKAEEVDVVVILAVDKESGRFFLGRLPPCLALHAAVVAAALSVVEVIVVAVEGGDFIGASRDEEEQGEEATVEGKECASVRPSSSHCCC